MDMRGKVGGTYGRNFQQVDAKYGDIVDQLKNVDKEVSIPVVTLLEVTGYRELEAFVYRVKRAVRGTYKKYSELELERLFLLHFLYAFKRAKIKNKTDVAKREKQAKELVERLIIKYYIHQKKDILKLIKWQSQLEE